MPHLLLEVNDSFPLGPGVCFDTMEGAGKRATAGGGFLGFGGVSVNSILLETCPGPLTGSEGRTMPSVDDEAF